MTPRSAVEFLSGDTLNPRTTATLYDRIGIGYSSVRQPDHRWVKAVQEAIGDASSVINIGAGSGAYEPRDRWVIGVEPSTEMRAQRPIGSAPCLSGWAEDLPFDDQTFDLAMAVLTVHHWGDLGRGIAEMLRVAARFVVLTYDMDIQSDFWLTRDYIPEIAQAEGSRVPSIQRLTGLLGSCEISTLPVWHDFTDGFMTAFWRRPEAYLDPLRRQSCSAFALTDQDAVERGIARLAGDLRSGAWAGRYRDLLDKDWIDAGFRLITGTSVRSGGGLRGVPRPTGGLGD